MPEMAGSMRALTLQFLQAHAIDVDLKGCRLKQKQPASGKTRTVISSLESCRQVGKASAGMRLLCDERFAWSAAFLFSSILAAEKMQFEAKKGSKTLRIRKTKPRSKVNGREICHPLVSKVFRV